MAYTCEGCGESGPDKEIKHKEDCMKQSVKKHCSKSGTAPHGAKK